MQVWKEMVPQKPFTYAFMDDRIREIHSAEIRFEKLFTWLTGVAIIISCLGLFALVTFISEQRAREVAIRKVMGASLRSIIIILNKDLLVILLISLSIASPVTLYFMNQWLETFAYHTEVAWWVVLIAAVATLAMLFLSTGYQSINASRSNPVKTLKS